MKPAHLPEFQRGVHYRDMLPVREGHGRYRFATTCGIRLPFKTPISGMVSYHDRSGRVWARHDPFGIYVMPGYAWNGCSPKYWVWPIGWVGTPDFEATRLASLIHDVHYQFSGTEHFPFHRSEVDKLFYHCIEMRGEPELAGVYYACVKKYGTWTGRPEDGAFSTRS